jgi:hypothetical protein
MSESEIHEDLGGNAANTSGLLNSHFTTIGELKIAAAPQNDERLILSSRHERLIRESDAGPLRHVYATTHFLLASGWSTNATRSCTVCLDTAPPCVARSGEMLGI